MGENVSSEEIPSSADPDNTYTIISYTEDGGTIIEMPINILSHAEFEETLNTKVFKDTNTPMLMDSEPCAKVSPRGNSFDITLYCVNTMEVRYNTLRLYSFPQDKKAYRTSYKFKEGEFPGEANGTILNYEDLEATLDILTKKGDKNYGYAYTVGLHASTKNQRFEVWPLNL